MIAPADHEAEVRAALTRRSEDAAGATDVGRARRRNEDAYWIEDSARFALVADGLGGLPDGHIASAAAITAAAEVLGRARRGHGDDGNEPAADPESADSAAATTEVAQRLARLLVEAFAAAQERVLAQPRRPGTELSMATTMIGAAIEGNLAVFLHVGDVRGYVWRQGRIAMVTSDHSRVGELVREGLLTREQIRHRPDRNIVTEVLGLPEGYRADVDAIELEEGDVVMLCSDGLWEAVEEDDVARLLEHAGSAAEAATWLIHAANAAGGRDNITVVVLRHGVSVPAAA